MFRTLLFLMLAVVASTASAGSTYYVRTDGGPPSSCNGTANAPLAGAVNKACAWSNPMYVFPPNIDGGDPKNVPLIKGGDTLIIGTGSYQMGLPFGSGTFASCNTSWGYDCRMQPVPSGTAAAPTQILGANYAACVNGAGAPKLLGAGGTSAVLNLTGSNFVRVQCLEITDSSNCIQNHTDPTVKCVAGGTWGSDGITNTDFKADNITSTNVTLQDLFIHGMAKFGVQAGNFSNYNVSHVRIIGNGFGGWSTDLDPAKSESNGVNNFTNVEIGFNGCTENYPTSNIYGCWGQSTGGYGDGFGSASSSEAGETRWTTDGDKGTWLFQDVSVHDNTQDGLDFLHADATAVVTFDRVNAYNNSGNQLKGSGTVTVTNSTVNANCSANQGKGSMKGDNSHGGATSGDNCRAGGDAVVFSLTSNHTMTMQHDTVISQGSCIITVADISGTSNSTGDATSKISVTDSVLLGLPGWIFNPDVKLSCLYYWNAASTAQYKTNMAMSSNVTWQTNGLPPAGNIVADPMLTNETVQAFDPTPLTGSPVIGKASDGTNIGSVQTSVVPPPPPPPTCIGGTVVNNVCNCPTGTTDIAGTCTAVKPPCQPSIVWTKTSQSTGTVQAVCQ